MFKDELARRWSLRWSLVLAAFLLPSAWAMPTNTILFIGDGMGYEHVAAAGYYANGTSGTLSFERFPYQGEVTTYSASAAITDSAAAATAMATGRKVNNGVISTALPGDGSELKTILEYAAEAGKRTGLVTTTAMTHATPAAFGAHEPSRNLGSRIAQDYLNQSRPNVLFGGSSYMAGASAAGYTVVDDATTMQKLDTDATTFVSGQFAGGHMAYEYDRTPGSSQPRLSEMTGVALEILDNDPDGFFLMVEGGRIDHAAHNNDVERTIGEVLEFSRAVQTAMDWAATASAIDTLVLVTADHETGGLAVTGNNGAGLYPDVTWTTTGHTAANVPIYGWGPGSDLITPVMDNTQVYALMTTEPYVAVPAPRATSLALVGVGLLVLRTRRQRDA